MVLPVMITARLLDLKDSHFNLNINLITINHYGGSYGILNGLIRNTIHISTSQNI